MRRLRSRKMLPAKAACLLWERFRPSDRSMENRRVLLSESTVALGPLVGVVTAFEAGVCATAGVAIQPAIKKPAHATPRTIFISSTRCFPYF